MSPVPVSIYTISWAKFQEGKQLNNCTLIPWNHSNGDTTRNQAWPAWSPHFRGRVRLSTVHREMSLRNVLHKCCRRKQQYCLDNEWYFHVHIPSRLITQSGVVMVTGHQCPEVTCNNTGMVNIHIHVVGSEPVGMCFPILNCSTLGQQSLTSVVPTWRYYMLISKVYSLLMVTSGYVYKYWHCTSIDIAQVWSHQNI